MFVRQSIQRFRTFRRGPAGIEESGTIIDYPLGLSLYEAKRQVMQHRRAQCQHSLINGATSAVGHAPLIMSRAASIVEAVDPAHRPIGASAASGATYLETTRVIRVATPPLGSNKLTSESATTSNRSSVCTRQASL